MWSANIIPLLLPFHMNLRWRESVEYFSSYASLKGCVGEIRKIERNKQYKPRMLMPNYWRSAEAVRL